MMYQSSEPINFDILIGAAIGLAVSIITSLIAHWLESKRNKQTRKWQLEDRGTNQKLELFSGRIDQVEKTVNDLKDTAAYVIRSEVFLMMGANQYTPSSEILNLSSVGNVDSFIRMLAMQQGIELSESGLKEKFGQELIQRFTDTAQKLNSITFDALKGTSVVMSLGDAELTNDYQQLTKLLSNEFGNLDRIAGLIGKKEIANYEFENSRIQQFLATVFSIHGKILQALDKKRILSVSDVV